jgi:hypothetical protein
MGVALKRWTVWRFAGLAMPISADEACSTYSLGAQLSLQRFNLETFS